MSNEWQKSVCQQPSTCSIASIGTFFRPVSKTEEGRSPIDSFYTEMFGIISTGKPETLSIYPNLGPLLLVAGISATENYFRDVFSKIIKICPIAQEASGDKAIPISSVIWHGSNDIERGAFEGQSLASSEYIMKAAKNFLKYQIEKDIGAQIFDEFEKLCQIRHNIVHSASILAGKNAVSLSIPSSDNRLKILIDFGALQESLSICSALVIGANKSLFVEISKRWAVDWIKLPSWSPDCEYDRFKSIWSLFYSQIDNDKGRIEQSISPIKARNLIKKFYGTSP
jgi:hypothetical protein